MGNTMSTMIWKITRRQGKYGGDLTLVWAILMYIQVDYADVYLQDFTKEGEEGF